MARTIWPEVSDQEGTAREVKRGDVANFLNCGLRSDFSGFDLQAAFGYPAFADQCSEDPTLTESGTEAALLLHFSMLARRTLFADQEGALERTREAAESCGLSFALTDYQAGFRPDEKPARSVSLTLKAHPRYVRFLVAEMTLGKKQIFAPSVEPWRCVTFAEGLGHGNFWQIGHHPRVSAQGQPPEGQPLFVSFEVGRTYQRSELPATTQAEQADLLFALNDLLGEVHALGSMAIRIRHGEPVRQPETLLGALWVKSYEPDAPQPLKKKCIGCGNSFETYIPHQKYCNHACQNRAGVRRFNERKKLASSIKDDSTRENRG